MGRPSRKLEWTRIGPFPICEKAGASYKLELLPGLNIHPVQLACKLTKDPDDPLPGQIPEPPPPVEINGE